MSARGHASIRAMRVVTLDRRTISRDFEISNPPHVTDGAIAVPETTQAEVTAAKRLITAKRRALTRLRDKRKHLEGRVPVKRLHAIEKRMRSVEKELRLAIEDWEQKQAALLRQPIREVAAELLSVFGHEEN